MKKYAVEHLDGCGYTHWDEAQYGMCDISLKNEFQNRVTHVRATYLSHIFIDIQCLIQIVKFNT